MPPSSSHCGHTSPERSLLSKQTKIEDGGGSSMMVVLFIIFVTSWSSFSCSFEIDLTSSKEKRVEAEDGDGLFMMDGWWCFCRPLCNLDYGSHV
eukprot:CAMPEP_0172308792 /NCGR_PEP_ID=MMETSP1058-20130122/9287_1 /TAXON_ID=83371 /ORGANISM="Detonula confervacea, Strain CCMP 353" /LENGTH=93 /DNA_ID=CAMNT_0013021295 /DNA_START=379 /DNA_END=660 /DNA_ORIENTATION=-